MKPSPLPWTIYDDGPNGLDIIMCHKESENGGENYDIAAMCDDLPDAERKSNAALIVQAVNAHEELIDAIELAMKTLLPAKDHKAVLGAYLILQEALAQIEKGGEK